MLEYDLESAESLLKKNLSNADTKLGQVLTDLDFLRYDLVTLRFIMSFYSYLHVRKLVLIKHCRYYIV